MDRVPKISVPRSTRPRNAFDLSQRHMFSAHVGMLLPILSLDLMPHDHVEINASDFMRLQSMNSASFVSMRGVYEFFFVPYSQLWHPFDQLVTGMKDFNSSLLSAKYSNSPSVVPSCSLVKLAGVYRDYNVGKAMTEDDMDIFGYSRKYNVGRIFDLLGYGDIDMASSGQSFVDKVLGNIKVTPLRALAYQKIYYDFYRNTTYESGSVADWNIDGVVGDIDPRAFVDSLQLRYRNVGLDMMTNVRPTPLFNLDNNPASYFAGKAPFVSSAENSVVANGWYNKDSSVSMVSVSSIRNAFALDKLLDVTMRAGKTYAEQMAAHFGVSVPEGRDHRVSYIGGFDSNFQVSDVTQVSGSSYADGDHVVQAGYLGKIVGKGVGSGNGRVVYDAKEHGILMCIYSIVPDMYYDYTRIDPFVRKQTRGDFFVPEFENLGMQPLDTVSISTNSSSVKSGVLGWQPRYSEYKTALDVNHGEFSDRGSLRNFSISRAREREYVDNFTSSSLKINPKWLDDVFMVSYNGDQKTDCAYGGCYFNIVKVSDMSVDGLPKL